MANSAPLIKDGSAFKLRFLIAPGSQTSLPHTARGPPEPSARRQKCDQAHSYPTGKVRKPQTVRAAEASDASQWPWEHAINSSIQSESSRISPADASIPGAHPPPRGPTEEPIRPHPLKKLTGQGVGGGETCVKPGQAAWGPAMVRRGLWVQSGPRRPRGVRVRVRVRRARARAALQVSGLRAAQSVPNPGACGVARTRVPRSLSGLPSAAPHPSIGPWRRKSSSNPQRDPGTPTVQTGKRAQNVRSGTWSQHPSPSPSHHGHQLKPAKELTRPGGHLPTFPVNTGPNAGTELENCVRPVPRPAGGPSGRRGFRRCPAESLLSSVPRGDGTLIKAELKLQSSTGTLISGGNIA